MQTVKVPFLSEDYFALSQVRPELAAAFALGPQVIALSGETAYEVIPAGSAAAPVVIPPATQPASTTTAETGVPPSPVPGFTAISGEGVSYPPASKGSLPCASALLPLVLVPLSIVWVRSRRRKF
jgi:hypothetical protein